jgi:hypothetical protein
MLYTLNDHKINIIHLCGKTWKSRHLLGEELGPLSVKELQQLEKQLECALSQARQRKVSYHSLPLCYEIYTFCFKANM